MINFNVPTYSDKTLEYILDTFKTGKISGDGKYTKLCHEWFNNYFKCYQSLLVHSGTAALEMASIIGNFNVGDEIIMPSYTFCSTANAFVLQGLVPVFVDIREDTLNIDETKIEQAITPRTKAIVPVHYAGVACEMDKIIEIAKKYNLLVIEDAAQAFDSFYKGKALGTIGDMGCFSFHETKNIMSGEGGLFITNNKEFAEKAEIIREKGTNRSRFFRGQVDKYTWVDKGSSYLPSDIIAAYLYSVLERSTDIQNKRKDIWNKYNESFKDLEKKGYIRCPIIPEECTNNAHMFYVILDSLETRTNFITYLKNNDIYAPFHYVPLHSSSAGIKYCKTATDMTITNRISETLVRLPLYYDLTLEDQDKVINSVIKFFSSKYIFFKRVSVW